MLRQSRRRLRPLALSAVPVLLLGLTQVSDISTFVGVPRASLSPTTAVARQADKGFGSGAKATKKKKSKKEINGKRVTAKEASYTFNLKSLNVVGEGEDGSEETSIVKIEWELDRRFENPRVVNRNTVRWDKQSSKSKALSKQRLTDLRDKTLAVRQKREEELDEYEMGKAMIAKYGREVAVMPQNVAERVAKRGMVIGGSFYATMLAVFAFGIVLFKTQEIVIPPTLMAFVTLALLALAIFGGSYGMMSASWDPNKEGSALGAEEFGDNMKILGEGFRKATLQTEYEKALDLRNERRKLLEAKEKKKQELLNK